jgi:hypothetical protein
MMKTKMLLATVAVTACAVIGNANAERLLALSVPTNGLFADTLIRFDSTSPGTINSALPITGLENDDVLVGIDYRPANGMLYGLGANRAVTVGRLYTLDPATGVGSPVGNSTFGLTGGFFGFDVNPVTDQIRLVSDFGQNLRLNPDTGEVAATDSLVAYAAGDPNRGFDPGIAAAAYGNNVAGATTTTLYDIDFLTDSLVLQAQQDSGTLTTIGATGLLAINGYIGFDISGATGTSYAAITTADEITRLYNINLQAGVAREFAVIGNGDILIDSLAAPVSPIPEPPTPLLILLTFGTLIVVRRYRAS